LSESFVSLRQSCRLAGVAALLTVAACASPPTVRTNVNPGTDFTQYKTFGFVDPLGTDRAGYRSIVSQHLIADTEREMQARGLTRSDSAPQLLVNFNAKLADALQVVPGPPAPVMVGVGGYYGYRAGMYSTWPMYSQDTVIQYTQGTLNIDVVDADHKQLVWESVVTDSVTQKDLDNLPVALNNAVVAAFAKFPIPVATQ
jgi:Domain of unknown function (DUF4136)